MLLEVKDLKTYFYVKKQELRAVDGVSFSLDTGRILGIVGESGCGKSVASMSILKLIDPQEGRITGGQVLFEGKDLASLNEKQMTRIRGNEISMIFQEPMTSLNPVFTIGYQLREAIITHQKTDKSTASKKSEELLELTRVPDASRVLKNYPHQLSGGMRQRVMIAMSLACNPKLLIADEPTTALDVTIQAQVLDLIRKIKEELNMAMLLITHDLGVIAEMADDVLVMYAGKVMERATALELFKNPKHPYTVGLMRSKPNILHDQEKLYAIPGQVPSLYDMPEGCPFHPRCGNAMEVCAKKFPGLSCLSGDHSVSCWLYEEGGAK
ncbi:MAG: ABC transporter ATP-binding protein [Clostridiales bacterium]|jgi:oligopeptide/dipeptide ABC transporter ATP-binding protein|nr:ABC transporter ATP-binding protein [Clostridiales bacterium]